MRVPALEGVQGCGVTLHSRMRVCLCVCGIVWQPVESCNLPVQLGCIWTYHGIRTYACLNYEMLCFVPYVRPVCVPLSVCVRVWVCEFPLALANCNKNNWKTFNFSLLKLLHMELAALLLLCFLILRSQGHNWQIDRHESLYPICTIPYTLSKYMWELCNSSTKA